MIMRQNPWRYNSPPGWRDIREAPRDGTVIETQNNYGIAPTFGLHKFVNGRWQYASDQNRSVGEGPHLSWREYAGAVENYVDPTGGAQETRAYWIQAAGLDPRSYGGQPFKKWVDEVAERSPTPSPKPGLWARMFGK